MKTNVLSQRILSNKRPVTQQSCGALISVMPLSPSDRLNVQSEQFNDSIIFPGRITDRRQPATAYQSRANQWNSSHRLDNNKLLAMQSQKMHYPKQNYYTEQAVSNLF